VRDLIRIDDGHLAVLPVCVERVVDFLARRERSAVPLSPGEIVTLAVSVLRGSAHVHQAGCSVAAAEWWLGEGGRPLLVAGAGAEAGEAGRAILTAIGHSADAALSQALDKAHAMLADPRELHAGIDGAEAALFAAAAPEPLATAVPAPARSVLTVSADAPSAHSVPAGSALDTPVSGWWRAVLPHIDRPLADLVSRSTTALWRRIRTDRPARRRRPVLFALAVAAIAVCGGLMLTRGAEPPASAQDYEHPAVRATTPAAIAPSMRAPAHTARETAAPAADPTPSGASAGAGEGVAGDTDIATATDALLTVRRSCRDSACRARTQENPAAELRGGAVDLPSAQRTVTLLDDFGSVAVLRIHARDGHEPDQYVVVALQDGSWLLRDVRDVAQQP